MALMIGLGALRELWSRLRRTEPMLAKSIEAAVKDVAIEMEAPAAPATTIEELHRKYEAMAEVDPRRAGRLKYEEMLRLHGQ